MMMSEFIDRTGFEPTAKEYAKIEDAYYNFDGDKDAFCKAFVKDGGARKLCKAMSRLMFALAGCWLVTASSEIFKKIALLWIGLALFLIVSVVGAVYVNRVTKIENHGTKI